MKIETLKNKDKFIVTGKDNYLHEGPLDYRWFDEKEGLHIAYYEPDDDYVRFPAGTQVIELSKHDYDDWLHEIYEAIADAESCNRNSMSHYGMSY